MKKKLMILGAGLLQLPAIRKAKELGLSVIVADMNPAAIGFEENGIEKLIVSTTDTASILKAAADKEIDGILTIASDVPMPTVAKVCEELGLKGISSITALRATNKAVMRESLSDASVPIPKFSVARDFEEFKEIASMFSGKVVVKSSDNSGNRGVSMIEIPCDVSVLRRAFGYAKDNTRDGRVVIEEYMAGPEFSVEGFSVNGKYIAVQVTDKITSGPPYFVEMGHIQPSAQSPEVLQAIKKVAERGVLALGITEGPSHTEVILTSEGPKIVEIGARLGGGCITSHLVPLSIGVDMIEANIKSALGESVDITPKFHKGAAICFFDSHAGTLCGVEGIQEALECDGVKDVSFFHKIGDKVNDLRTGLDRVGYVIAQGDSREEAIANCERGVRKITLKLE